MARIRTIKPEFPQSESVGALSRDARLLFVQLWTVVDDAGRTRAASRMLASLLYPYDDDAGSLIDGWLSELEVKGCIRRYEVEGSTYLEIINWLKHQKIDRPSTSRIPAFPETIAKPREDSRTLAADLGPRTDDDVEDSREPSRSLVSSEASKLADEVAKIVGHDLDFVPPSWYGAPYRAQQWLNQGWPTEIILLSVREQTARKRDGPPSKIEYFEKGIASAIARQSSPLPEIPKGEQRNGSSTKSGLAAIDRLFQPFQDRDRPDALAVPHEDVVLSLPAGSIRGP